MRRRSGLNPAPVAGALLIAVLALSAQADPVELARTRAAPVLAESVAFDAHGRLLVSAVHAGGVFRPGRGGALARWSAGAMSGRTGFFGIVADPARHVLWAATTGGVYSGGPMVAPALWRFDLRTGRTLGVVNGAAEAKSFGDIALGPDGTVFVSDSGAGEVLKLAPDTRALERVIKLDGRASPQGLVVSDDGGVLVFSNYADGLHRVDLRTGAHSRVRSADGGGLRGIDGVARRGDDLILVYNGGTPARVLLATLDADWTRIERIQTLAEGAPMVEPTGGVVRGGDFIFVSRSQWSDFDAEGRPRPGLAPAIVSRLPLPGARAPTPSGG